MGRLILICGPHRLHRMGKRFGMERSDRMGRTSMDAITSETFGGASLDWSAKLGFIFGAVSFFLSYLIFSAFNLVINILNNCRGRKPLSREGLGRPRRGKCLPSEGVPKVPVLDRDRFAGRVSGEPANDPIINCQLSIDNYDVTFMRPIDLGCRPGTPCPRCVRRKRMGLIQSGKIIRRNRRGR
jgi:hypothetical protein